METAAAAPPACVGVTRRKRSFNEVVDVGGEKGFFALNPPRGPHTHTHHECLHSGAVMDRGLTQRVAGGSGPVGSGPLAAVVLQENILVQIYIIYNIIYE